MLAALAYWNLLGLALLAARWTGSYGVARLFTPVAVALVGFFVEHFVGLGARLGWVGLLGSMGTAWVVYRERGELRRQLELEAVLAAVFAYALAWRYGYPDLDGTNSEKLTDFTFLLNYWGGTVLPPVDLWLPPYRFSMYYALQHYAAALLGRMHGMTPGMTYHFCFALLAGLGGMAAWMAVREVAGRRWQAALALVAVISGGTGAAVVLPWMKEVLYPADAMRFIGGAATPKAVTKPLGKWIVGVAGVPEENALELPIETFGYLFQLGDYHPPLSGYFLMFAALACMVWLERETSRVGMAAVAATVPLMVGANAWQAPLQALLVVVWLGYRLWKGRLVAWGALVAGGVVPGVLLAPFLWHFSRSSSGAGMAFRLVPGDVHTPVLLGVLLWLPALLIVVGAAGWRQCSGLVRALLVFVVVALVGTELVYVDDLYSGQYTRFNTTLKWWGPVYAVTLLMIGAALLGAKERWRQGLALVGLLLPCMFYQQLGQYVATTTRPHAGMWEGYGHLTDDGANPGLIEYLKQQPRSIVLQRPEKPAYAAAPGLVLFSGQMPFLGWQFHEQTWRGDLPALRTRASEVEQFYAGAMADPAAWMDKNGIRYVLWTRAEHALNPGTWERISVGLAGRYEWREFWRDDEWRVGLWELGDQR